MRTDNQHKRGNYESNLDLLLKTSFEERKIEVLNGRISRDWLRSNIGCSQNWPNQNKHAKSEIARYEKLLRDEGYNVMLSSPASSTKSKDFKDLLKRVTSLEQKNAQLLEENNHYRQRLAENGWLASDEEHAAQGRLPW